MIDFVAIALPLMLAQWGPPPVTVHHSAGHDEGEGEEMDPVVMAEQSTRASKRAVIASNFYISTLTLDLSESRVPKYCDS